MSWRKLIVEKFRDELRGPCSQKEKECHGVGLWNALEKDGKL